MEKPKALSFNCQEMARHIVSLIALTVKKWQDTFVSLIALTVKRW
jgi:hypothetical protein